MELHDGKSWTKKKKNYLKERERRGVERVYVRATTADTKLTAFVLLAANGDAERLRTKFAHVIGCWVTSDGDEIMVLEVE